MRAEQLARLLGARKSGKDWSARCPAHPDRVASLSIAEGADGRVLLHCHAGCAPEAVLEHSGGLSIADVMGDDPVADQTVQSRVLYDYRDEDRKLLYQVVKTILPGGRKRFAQRRPNGADGGWVWGLGEVRRVLYRLPELCEDPAAEVLIPEGEKDVEALRALGFTATTNLGGAGKWRDEFSPFLAGRHVVLLPDNDDVGKSHMRNLETALNGHAASVVTVEIPGLPPKGDVSDYLQSGGTAGSLRSLIEKERLGKTHLVPPGELSALLESYYLSGTPSGVTTGWPSLDALYTVRKGEFTVVSGIPGHGKTSWLDALLVNLAQIHGWRTGIFSAENLPIERHAAGLAEKFTGKPFGRRGDGWRMSCEQLAAAADFLARHFRFIRPREDGQNLEAIFEAMRECVAESLDCIVLDPWNEIDHALGGMSETDYVDVSLRRLRRFARYHSVALFVVVHPAKMRRDPSGAYPVPTLYDAHGSAHWRNKADNGIVVWRDVLDEAAGTSVYVQKIRFREVGRVGTCTLHYQYSSGRYEDRAAEPDPEPRTPSLFDQGGGH